MNQTRRFKAALGPEGRLFALGRDEVPEPEAKQRVARRLGISAAALASAAAATAIAPSATAAAATAGAKGVGSLAAIFGKAAGPFIASTVVKATLIGLGLGAASYAGVKVYTSRVSVNPPSAAVTTIVAPKPRQPTPDPVGASAETALVVQDALPEVANARPNAAALGTAVASPAEPAPLANTVEPGALQVARFEDDPESPPAPSVVGTAAPLLPGQAPSPNTGPPHASTLPADPRLAREVASLDLARARANHGDAAGALRELNTFQSSDGYMALRKEAMLVKIDVLLSLGQEGAAAAIARQLLAMGVPGNQRARLEALVRSQP